MPTVTIVINTDNAAFEENAGNETARILRELAEKIATGNADAITDTGSEVLRDINGNSVGYIEMTQDEEK